jgi:ornithine cyclodeaminase/alanine dehydrogenase
MKTALISKGQIEKVLDMDMVLNTVDEVFKAHGNQEAILPAKITLDLSPVGMQAFSNAMPAYVHTLKAAGIKWAGGFPNNPGKNLGYLMATIILQDPETGIPLAVMDGVHITNLRTGAVAGICAKYLANPGSEIVAIIGAGQQGRTSLSAISRLFRLKEARAYDLRPEISKGYAREMETATGVKVLPVSHPRDAVENADIVVTATHADEPAVLNEWLKQGVLSVSLGTYQEFDEESVLRADKVLVDNWEQCSHRGELKKLVARGRFKQEMVYAEIGEVAAGLKPGRNSPTEKIMAVPIGLGTHDVAVGCRAYEMLKGDCQYFEFF